MAAPKCLTAHVSHAEFRELEACVKTFPQIYPGVKAPL